MKVITFSRHFPKGHPKAGQPTHFVEKIESCLADIIPGWEMSKTFTLHEWEPYYNCTMPKHHTIRTGSRFKPGETVSLRVWSDKPYRSRQIEFAQVEVKKTWAFKLRPIKVHDAREVRVYRFINNILVTDAMAKEIASNDGLSIEDFDAWFCPAGTKFIVNVPIFEGQIICWNDNIEYNI